MIDVVDALRALAEEAVPGPAYDATCAAPFEWQPETVYAWAESVIHRSVGTGEVREDFEVAIVYSTGNEGEEAVLTRSRDVSLRLDAWRTAVLDAVRARAHVPPWDSGNIAGRSDEDFLRQLEVRGVAVMVGGYRLKS